MKRICNGRMTFADRKFVYVSQGSLHVTAYVRKGFTEAKFIPKARAGSKKRLGGRGRWGRRPPGPLPGRLGGKRLGERGS